MTHFSNIAEVINARVSVRCFMPPPVSEAVLSTVIAAAIRAPTAVHGEPWQFVIVQDTDLLKRLSDKAKECLVAEAEHLHMDRGGLSIFSEPGFNVFYDAGTLIVICSKDNGKFAEADCWLAAENLMLSAFALGLGTCVIGSAVSALNLPSIKAELGIPANSVAVVPIVIGTPRETPRPSERKEPVILSRR